MASDTAHRHAETLDAPTHPGDAHAFVTDVTSAFAQLNVQGPRSRELLQSMTSADLSNEAFPFRTAREIDIGYARVLCIRITYLGELGYELYIPAEQATHVYDRLVAAGAALGLRHAGLKALASLRMEKGYRDYGHDIDNTDSVLEAGLGFAVDLDKPGGFIGRDAVLAQKADGPLRQAPRAGAGQRPRAACCSTPSRCCATDCGRLRPRRILRPHPWRRGRPGDDRGRRADRPGLAGRRHLGGRHRRPPVCRGCVVATALRPEEPAHQDLALV